jgi:hypothetical protein
MAKEAVFANNRIVSGKTVTEAELLAVEAQRSHVANLKNQLANSERALAELEADVVAKLEAGFQVRSKHLSAGLEASVGARRPEWKDLYLEHMEDVHGEPRLVEEKRILDHTAGKPKQRLVILHKK